MDSSSHQTSSNYSDSNSAYNSIPQLGVTTNDNSNDEKVTNEELNDQEIAMEELSNNQSSGNYKTPQVLDPVNNKEEPETSNASSDVMDNQKIKLSPQDMVNARPPNFNQRVHRFFYDHGMASMPSYMREYYLQTPRYIYVNQNLPDFMKYPNGQPIIPYAKNKIRTTKYTVMSFIPKNLFIQFRNAANSYFLLLVILGAFQIFGVESPGLAAVPLIVIVCITAIRDAFEDYRRDVTDYELNNSPIHLLNGIHNPNVEKDQVSSWRKFKKNCTRINRSVRKSIVKACIMIFASKKTKQDYTRKEVEENAYNLQRVSTIISENSIARNNYRSPSSDDYYYRPSYDIRQSRDRPRSLYHNKRRSQLMKDEPQDFSDSILNPKLIKESFDSGAKVNFKNRRWKDICVGDFIRVRSNEEVPADMIIISTSDSEGHCFIETKNLDGETNLKTKKSIEAGGLSHIRQSKDLGNAKFWIECDPPNTHLYSFKGTMHYENYDQDGNLVNPDEKESLNNDNILLRGSSIKNTKWVIGVVVYTGSESKIMLSSGITPAKKSKISRDLNFSVYVNFGILFILCFVSAVINGLYYDKTDTSRIYYEFEPYASTPAVNAIVCFFVVLIIYQSLVPISLYISVEIIKTCQAFFIFSDIKMYYEKLNYPCVPKSWNISDDLGQIEYVFSDKTGTLTQNIMEFKKCTINGKSYGLAYTEAKQGLDKRNGVDVVKEQELWKAKIKEDRELMLDYITKHTNNNQFRDSALTFVSSDYMKDTFLDTLSDENQKKSNEHFMLALALCHTVMTESNAEDETLRDFKAESPDEAALVSVARDVGIVFKGRKKNNIYLEIYGKEVTYELLETIAFSSARKRMSCFIKTPEGKVMLFSKGADSVIFQRLSSSENSPEMISKTALYLEDFAKEGLRTLCIAEKEVDQSYFESWYKRYKEAKASIDDDRDEKLDRISDEVEQDLVLLGGTAIEDRLQQGVPDSISLLSQAGIKLWVLTGDKIETAINIGFSCNLLNNDMTLLVVRPDEQDPENLDYLDNLVSLYLKSNLEIEDTSKENIDKLVLDAKNDHSTPKNNVGLIIDGDALIHVFLTDAKGKVDETHMNLRKKFLLLGKFCKSVICCRVSPAQKAQVVKLVKEELSVMTLAIGDGANDVAMIQSADVGVGIAGEEGRQAVMSSDYGIGQFRFLTRLLLVHGKWSYKRLAEMVPCFFYKNVLFTMTCFWYGIYSDFDGTYLYDYTVLMFYNLAYTSLPIIFLAVFDQDVSDTVSLIVPQLYRSGIFRQEWSQTKFAWYMFDGLFQSVVAYFFVYLTYYVSFQNAQGLCVDHRFWQGVVCSVISVTAADLYVILHQYRWDWLSCLICAISILIVFFWTGIYSAGSLAQEFYKSGAQVFGTLSLWCTMFIGIVICLLPRFTYDFLKLNFAPRDVDIIRERARKGEFDEYPEGFDPTNLEDVEKLRLLKELCAHDPNTLAKLEKELDLDHPSEVPEGSQIGKKISTSSQSTPEANNGDNTDHNDNPFTKTFKTIRRRATTLKSSRRSTVNHSFNNTFQKPIDLNKYREQMLRSGELNGGGLGGNSLSRINTTHELPGLTQAETLISYHTRTSMNFDR